MNEDTQCPVCGYYCLGKGGHGCINKPELLNPPHHVPNWCSFNDLRFVIRREFLPEASDGTRQYIDRRVLQQLWRDINTTLKHSYYLHPEEWRDVPIVQEEE